MKYTDKIHFANVKDFQGQISAGPLSVNNNYTVTGDNPDDATITKISQKVINAVDIDWNEACFNVYGTTFEDPKYKIRTTGDLLDTLRECADTSYTRANEAYELASAASGNTSGVFMFREDKSPYKYVTPTKSGEIKLSYISDNSYLPVTINFEYANSRLDFGISKNNLVSYLRTTDLGGGTEYSAGDGIIIDDHEISIDTNFIDSNCITGMSATAPIRLTLNGDPNIKIEIDNSYFTTKKLKDTDPVESLTLTDEIINKINSTGGQGIEYTGGIGIDIDNNIISTKFNVSQGIGTNNTGNARNLFVAKAENNSYLKFVDNDSKLAVDIDAVKTYIGNLGNSGITITDVSNYLNEQHYVTKGGGTTGTLAVIDGTQVNASAATISGSDIYVSSDKKLKDNILDIRQDEVDKLFATESGNMHYFEWRESHKPSFGFIAQELMDFAPETVTKDSEYMQVNYNAALTKTCAALFKKIKELENRIEKLENK